MNSGGFLPPSPPAEKATAGKPATIARIMVGGGPFYSHAPGLPDGGEIDRLGVRCLSWLSSLSASPHICCWTQNSVHQSGEDRSQKWRRRGPKDAGRTPRGRHIAPAANADRLRRPRWRNGQP